MTRSLVLLAVVLVVAVGSTSLAPLEGAAALNGTGATFGVGLMLLVSLLAAQVTEVIRLPHVTAWILAGLAIGPDGAGLLTPAMLGDLSLVKSVAVGLIALLAGCELNLRALAPRLRPIGALATAGLVGAFLALFVALLGLTFALPFGEGLSVGGRVAAALVCANALCAFSPPVVIGVLNESKARGPLTELWISIVVLADILIVLTFSMSSAAAQVLGGESGAEGGLGAAAAHILGSLGAGAVVGPLLALYISRIGRRIGLFVFGALFVMAQAGGPLHLDPLLVGLTAGLFLENLSPVSGEQVIHQTEVAALPTFAVFFTLIGASIHLHDFFAVAPWAVLLAGLRAAGLFGGVRLLGGRGGVDPAAARLAPFGMLPQAGIAIALATAIGATHPGWGPGAATLLLGTIVVNELIGPVVFRAAVVRSGEAGQRPEVHRSDLPGHAAPVGEQPSVITQIGEALTVTTLTAEPLISTGPPAAGAPKV
jgi:Kef-type K+ transport system membrane component KefB